MERPVLFGWIRFFSVGTAKQIICADAIKCGKFHNGINGIVQNTNLILRISVLTDSQILSNLFLCVSAINSQVADIFVFHNFITHIIT